MPPMGTSRDNPKGLFFKGSPSRLSCSPLVTIEFQWSPSSVMTELLQNGAAPKVARIRVQSKRSVFEGNSEHHLVSDQFHFQPIKRSFLFRIPSPFLVLFQEIVERSGEGTEVGNKTA